MSDLRGRLDAALLTFCGGSFEAPAFADLTRAATRLHRRLRRAGLARELTLAEALGDDDHRLFLCQTDEADDPWAFLFSSLGPFFCVLGPTAEPLEGLSLSPAVWTALDAHLEALGRPAFVPASVLRRPSPLCDPGHPDDPGRPLSYFSALFEPAEQYDGWPIWPATPTAH